MADVRERIKFDGWELTEGTVRDWEVRDGMDGVPGMIGDNLTVANRSGEVWRPKVMGSGKFTVQLWLAGKTISAAQDAWRTLLRATVRPHRLVRVQRTMASGEVIYCNAEVTGGVEPTHLALNVYRASITFNVPEGVWYSEKVYGHETPAGHTGVTLYLPGLAPSTAPLENLTYTFWGRVTNPHILDNTDGGYLDKLTYSNTIASGKYLQFDAATWGIGGNTPAANNDITPTGRRLMTIGAERPGDTPSVRFEGSSPDSKTKLRISGRRVYLC